MPTHSATANHRGEQLAGLPDDDREQQQADARPGPRPPSAPGPESLREATEVTAVTGREIATVAWAR